MLGKLVKYDFKALSKFLLLTHGFTLLFSAVVRILFPSIKESIVFAFALIVYMLLLMAVCFSTYIIIAVYFYKNLFTDEGYLTRTLPVSRGSHLLSKTIAGTCWAILDFLVIMFSVGILTYFPELWREAFRHQGEIMTALGLPADFGLAKLGAAFFLLACIQCLSSVLIIYVSISIGQLVPSHKVLSSIAVYFAISTALSILGIVFSIIFLSPTASPEYLELRMQDPNLMVHLTLASSALCLITGIISYAVSYLIFIKKSDLS